MRGTVKTLWSGGGQAIAGVSASAMAIVALYGFALAQHAQYVARIAAR
jgi:hypothetical protein